MLIRLGETGQSMKERGKKVKKGEGFPCQGVGEMTILSPSLALCLVYVCSLTPLGLHDPGLFGNSFAHLTNACQGQNRGRLALTLHKFVKNNMISPLRDTWVVPQDLIRCWVSIRYMQTL